MKTFKSLCIPAKVYLALSVVSILALLFDPSFSQTMGPSQQLSIFKFFFILAWTYILNMICKAGYTNISWFFVLLPFFIMFGMIISLSLSCGA